MSNAVSLVLPLFNEAAYIKLAIPQAVLALQEFDYEIIVVDDASTDDSPVLVQELIRDNERIKLLRHARNRGLGAAIRTGFDAAAKDIIIYADSDLPFDFSILRKLLPLIESADIVHGYRVGKRESFKRTLYSWIYNVLIKTVFRIPIRDISFALDIVRRPVAQKLELKFEAGFFATELLTKASYLGCRIVQFPVPYAHRVFGVSRLSSFRNILKSLLELFRNYAEIVSFRKKSGIKRVIVNADDFGLTHEVNAGVIKAFKDGIVTSASILSVGGAFAEAVQLAGQHERLGIGIHLCLTEETPISDRDKVSTLVQPNGFFWKSWKHLLLRWVSGRINLSEVEAELEAQIRKVVDSGIVPTHIDSHQYVHLFPFISDIVIRLAKKYKIRHIRCPNERGRLFRPTFSGLWKWALFSLALSWAKPKLEYRGFSCADHFWGAYLSGKLDPDILRSYFQSLSNGVSEIVCHPGENMRDLYGHWGYAWDQELAALTDVSAKKLPSEYGVRLVNYKTVYAK
jgi:predicted glycoside hydrolase/deacetylase ChbG (UPF0249 family)